jgi:hypothetical protein
MLYCIVSFLLAIIPLNLKNYALKMKYTSGEIRTRILIKITPIKFDGTTSKD